MRASTNDKIERQIRLFWISSLLCLAALIVAGVSQVNALTHDNSQFSGLKRQIASITAENEELEASLSAANSMNNFENYVLAIGGNFEKVNVASVRYISLDGRQIAKK